MKCFAPFFKRTPEGVVCFPCGSCATCRASQNLIWSLRMHLESLYYRENAYITLTYAPEHLPENGSLQPSHLQNFFKRLRRFLDYKIRYFACGEYGDKFGRAHYHAIIFGLKHSDFSLVKKCWKFGIIDVQVPRREAFQYVAGYVSKKVGKMVDWIKNNPGKVPPFQRCSLGLGLRFIMEKIPFFTSVLNIAGKTRYIGRYLRNKLAEKFGVSEQVKMQGIQNLVANLECIVSEYFYSGAEPDPLSNFDKFADYRNAWQWKYSGYFDNFLAQMKIRQINYRRSST